MKRLKTILTLLALSPAAALAASPSNSHFFEFNHLQQQLGAGMSKRGEEQNFQAVFLAHKDMNYGGIALNKRMANALDRNGNGAVFNYGLSITENNKDYNWQFDGYFTGSYEFALSRDTQVNVGISFSLNGQPYRMFFNDADNKVATAYSLGPVVGLRHTMQLAPSQTLTPFAHYFYSSQSVSSRSLWNIFADAFTDPEKDRSVHDYRDVFVAGMRADFNNFLITPAYIKSDSKESWYLSIGVSY